MTTAGIGPSEVPARVANKWVALAIASLALFVIGFNTTAINTALNPIADELRLPASTLDWAVNAYMLAVAALVALGGQLGDVIGRRRMFMIGTGCFAVGSVVVASATGAAQLIIGRAVQGVGAACLMPSTTALLERSFPPEELGFAMGIWGAVAGLAFAVGPVMGGLLIQLSGWRSIFWVSVPVMAIVTVMTALSLHPLPAARGRRIDSSGGALLAAGLFAVVIAAEQGPRWGWGSPSTLLVLLAGVALLGAFVALEHRKDDPLIQLDDFRSRSFVGGNLATLINAVALIGILYYFNVYAQSELLLDYSPLRASVALLPMGGAMLVLSIAAGRIGDRVPLRWPITAGMAIMAVGALLMGGVTAQTSYSQLWVPLMLLGAGIGITLSLASQAAAAALPESQAGEASGVVNMFRYVGGAAAIAVGALVYTRAGHGELVARLAATPVHSVNVVQSRDLLVGTYSAIDKAVSQLGPGSKPFLMEAARHAAAASYSGAMIFIGVVSLVGAVLSMWLLAPAHRGAGD